jgi:hypothetical protein
MPPLQGLLQEHAAADAHTHLIVPAAHAELATHAGAGGAVVHTHAVLGQSKAHQMDTTPIASPPQYTLHPQILCKLSKLPLPSHGLFRTVGECLGHEEGCHVVAGRKWEVS